MNRLQALCVARHGEVGKALLEARRIEQVVLRIARQQLADRARGAGKQPGGGERPARHHVVGRVAAERRGGLLVCVLITRPVPPG